MESRIFRAVLAWKLQNKNHGGRGCTASTKFIRLPGDVLWELDEVIEEFKTRYGGSASTPRSERLFELIGRLEELLPPVSPD